MIDFDDLDQKAKDKLKNDGYVWYKRNNCIHYISQEWIDNAKKLGLLNDRTQDQSERRFKNSSL